jgi:hypothetical protein
LPPAGTETFFCGYPGKQEKALCCTMPIQSSYVSGYLKDEVAAEGLVRNLPGHSQFLDMAALVDGEMVNYSTISSQILHP